MMAGVSGIGVDRQRETKNKIIYSINFLYIVELLQVRVRACDRCDVSAHDVDINTQARCTHWTLVTTTTVKSSLLPMDHV